MRKFRLFVLAILLLALPANNAFAATSNLNATATILQDILITEDTAMTFGIIQGPDAGTSPQNFVLDFADTVTPGPGSGASLGSALSGDLSLAGVPSDTANLTTGTTIFPVTCTGGTGVVTLTAVTIETAAVNLAAVTGIGTTVLGGTLRVETAATGGFTCAYNIDANY